MDDKGNLYQAVINICLNATEAGNEIQERVNDELRKLKVIEQYPLILVDVIINENEDYDVRHLASIFLKNHLEDVMHMSPQNEYYLVLNSKSVGNKILIQLLNSLDCIQEKRLLEMVATILSSLLCIGHWDQLSQILSQMAVNFKNPKEIGDAMLILNIAISEKYLINPNFPAIEPHWFVTMLNVLKMKNIPSATRKLTLDPMFQMLKNINPYPDFVQDNLQRLAEVFESVLNEPCSEACHFLLKVEIFEVIFKLLKIFSDKTNIFIPPLLPVVGSLLMNCCEQFKSYLRGAAKAITDPDEQEPELYYELVDKLLLFLSKLIDMPYFDVLLESLENVIYCVIVFMSCHRRMAKQLFIDPIDRIGFLWILRTSSADILVNLVHKLSLRQPTGKSTFLKSLENVFTRLRLESNAVDNVEHDKVFYFNSITESMAYTLGLLSDKISTDNIDFLCFVECYLVLWTDYLYRCEPMLVGRILLVGGQYCRQITLHTFREHAKFIFEYLRGSREYLLKPCADALSCYMENFRALPQDRRLFLRSVESNIMKSIFYISSSNVYPMQETLICLTHALQLNENILDRYTSGIENILIEAVRHNSYSPVINALNWTVSKLAQTTTFGPDYEFPIFLYNRLDHGLSSHLNNFNLEHVLEVLNTILVFSPKTLNATYVLQVFSRSFHAMQLLEEDLYILEASAQLIVTCFVKYHMVLVGYRYNKEDKQYAAIFELPTIFEKLLQNNLYVSSTVFGRMINFAMLRVSEVIEPYYENIIRNVVTSFGNGNLREHNFKFITNWTVFIYFLMIRPVETIKFLSLLPGPNIGSALEHILFMFEASHLPQCDYIDRRMIVFSIIGLLKEILADAENFQIFQTISVELEDHQAICSVNGLTYLYSILINCLLFEHNLKYPMGQSSIQIDIPENLRSQVDYCLYDRDFEPLMFQTESYIINFLRPLNAICYSAIVHTIHEGHYGKLRMLGLEVPQGTHRCNMRCCAETME